MVVNIKGLFVPNGMDSYFIVDPITYENVVGFPPVTYRELYGLRSYAGLKEADRPIESNDLFEDMVNLYGYEIIYNDLIEFESTQEIAKMIDKLTKLDRIININFNVNVKENE